MPVVRSPGEGGSPWNLESIFIQVDSVLTADGWRPARRAQNISRHKKAQKAQIIFEPFVLFCG